jgi:hypothetical protein
MLIFIQKIKLIFLAILLEFISYTIVIQTPFGVATYNKNIDLFKNSIL